MEIEKDYSFINSFRKILNEKQTQYGDPKNNFLDIAKRWSSIVGCNITDRQVAIMMIDLKIVRLLSSDDDKDTLLDICGYCECISRIK